MNIRLVNLSKWALDDPTRFDEKSVPECFSATAIKAFIRIRWISLWLAFWSFPPLDPPPDESMGILERMKLRFSDFWKSGMLAVYSLKHLDHSSKLLNF